MTKPVLSSIKEDQVENTENNVEDNAFNIQQAESVKVEQSVDKLGTSKVEKTPPNGVANLSPDMIAKPITGHNDQGKQSYDFDAIESKNNDTFTSEKQVMPEKTANNIKQPLKTQSKDMVNKTFKNIKTIEEPINMKSGTNVAVHGKSNPGRPASF